MRKIILYQSIILLALAGLAAVLSGWQAAWSLVLGGLCYLVPTALTVLVLSFFQASPALMPLGFVIGESSKVVLAIMLMALTFYVYPSVQWMPFFIGLLAVSHIVFFVFWKLTHHGK